ncbi:MAG: hypothetical protein Dbin4_00997 [Alphaproteobacteria bacterium]|nr:hypothetical protein [Alphaproteobacteria bacterium]
MPDTRHAKLKPALLSVLLLMAAGAFPAGAQETVYIGGRDPGPAVEVDLSAIGGNRGGIPVRRTRPGPPDILPHDPANGPKARAAISAALTAPTPLAPTSRTSPVAALVPPPQAAPALPASSGLAALPPAPGLTPAAPPPQAVAKTGLSASPPPQPITPAKPAAPDAISPAPPAVKPPPVAPPKTVAALPAGLTPAAPKSSAPAAGVSAAILFAPGAVELTPGATAQLDAVLAGLSGTQRVQLKAYAAGAPDDAEVRRTSLKRALSVRSHLLAAGMESTRIDVRALGPAGDGGPDDRLDVIVVAP